MSDNKIMCIRLSTGEDLIAEIGLPTADRPTYVIDEPLLIMLVPVQTAPNGPQKMAIQLVPFLGYASQRVFEWNPDMVCTTYAPTEKLEDEYRKVFGRVQVAHRAPLVGLDGSQL